MSLFHAEQSELGLIVNVIRHPYSFLGNQRRPSPGGLAGAWVEEGKEPTWHECLLGYLGGNQQVRAETEAAWKAQARKAGVDLDFSVQTQWQPVDSQRVMLLAAKSGKQEPYIEALNTRHFMKAQSASHRDTILEAAETAGLNRSEVHAFLETDVFVDEIWESYRSTIEDKGIRSIPLFVFNVDGLTNGGPFGSGGRCWQVSGAREAEYFLRVFKEAAAVARTHVPNREG